MADILDVISTYNPSAYAQGNQLRDQAIADQAAQVKQRQAATSQTIEATKAVQLENQQRVRELRDMSAYSEAFRRVGDPEKTLLDTQFRQQVSAPGFMKIANELALQKKNAADAAKFTQDANKTSAEVLDKFHNYLGSVASDLLDRGASEPEISAALSVAAQAHPEGKQEIGPLLQGLQENPGNGKLVLQHIISETGYGPTRTAAKNEAALKGAQTDSARAEQKLREAEIPGKAAEAKLAQSKLDFISAAKKDPTQGASLIDQALPATLDQTANAGYKAAYQAHLQIGDIEGAARTVATAAEHAASMSPQKQQADINKAVNQEKALMPGRVATAAAETTARFKANADSLFPGQEGQDAIDMMAEKALAGQPVPLARNPAMQGRIYARAAELARGRGLTTQQAVMEGNAAKANVGALTAVTKQYETLKPFAEMAEKNADLLEKRIQDVTNLGAPVLNTPIRALEAKFLGDPKVSALRAALAPVQADFARILNSPTGSGVLSDNARHEMQEALDPGATPQQIKAALDVFRQDARNRKAAYEQQLGDLKRSTVVGGNASAGGSRTAVEALPATLSASDVGKVYKSPKTGKNLKITAVNPADPKQFRSEDAP